MYICVFTLYISRTHAQTPPELQAAMFCKGDHWKLYTVQGFAVSVDVNLTKSPIRSTFLLTNPKGSRITSIGIPGALAAAHLILEPLGDRGIWTFIHSDLSRGVFLGQLEPLTFHNRGVFRACQTWHSKPRNRGSAHGASRMLRSSTQGLGNAAGMETMPAIDQP